MHKNSSPFQLLAAAGVALLAIAAASMLTFVGTQAAPSARALDGDAGAVPALSIDALRVHPQ